MTLLFNILQDNKIIGYVSLSEAPYEFSITVTPIEHFNTVTPLILQAMGLPSQWFIQAYGETVSIQQTTTKPIPPLPAMLLQPISITESQYYKTLRFEKGRGHSFYLNIEKTSIIFQAFVQLTNNLDFLIESLDKNNYQAILPNKSLDLKTELQKNIKGTLKDLLIYDKTIIESLPPEASSQWEALFNITNKAAIDIISKLPLPTSKIFTDSLEIDKIVSMLQEKIRINQNRFIQWGKRYAEHRYPQPDTLQKRKKETLQNLCAQVAPPDQDVHKIRTAIRTVQIAEKINHPDDHSFVSGAFSSCIRDLCLRHLAYEIYCAHLQERYNRLMVDVTELQEELPKYKYFTNDSIARIYRNWQELYTTSHQLLKNVEGLTNFDNAPSLAMFEYQYGSPPPWQLPSNPEAIQAIADAEAMLPKTIFESIITTTAAPLVYTRDALVNTASAAVGWMSSWVYPKP